MSTQFISGSTAIELVKIAAVLLALSLTHLHVNHFVHDKRWNGIINGLVYGTISIVGMATPVYLQPGVIFDARSVILSVGALFGGPLTGIIAGAIATAFRLWLGGAGAYVGVGVIVLCVALGLAFRFAIEKHWLLDRWWNYATFSIIVHLAALGCFLALPGQVAENVLANISGPFFIVLAPCTFILAMITKTNSKISETLPAIDKGS